MYSCFLFDSCFGLGSTHLIGKYLFALYDLKSNEKTSIFLSYTANIDEKRGAPPQLQTECPYDGF